MRKLPRGVVAAAMITVTTLGIVATGAAYADDPAPSGSSSQENSGQDNDQNDEGFAEFQVTFQNNSEVENFSACVIAPGFAAQCTNGGVNAGESAQVRGLAASLGDEVTINVRLNGLDTEQFEEVAEARDGLTVEVSGDENQLDLAVE